MGSFECGGISRSRAYPDKPQTQQGNHDMQSKDSSKYVIGIFTICDQLSHSQRASALNAQFSMNQPPRLVLAAYSTIDRGQSITAVNVLETTSANPALLPGPIALILPERKHWRMWNQYLSTIPNVPPFFALPLALDADRIVDPSKEKRVPLTYSSSGAHPQTY